MDPKVQYDKESNILVITLNKKRSVDSDIKGNVAIDYDKDGEIVRIEIMSVNIGEFNMIKSSIPLKELVRA